MARARKIPVTLARVGRIRIELRDAQGLVLSAVDGVPRARDLVHALAGTCAAGEAIELTLIDIRADEWFQAPAAPPVARFELMGVTRGPKRKRPRQR